MKQRPSLGVIFLTIFIDLLGFGIVMPFLTLVARDAFGVEEWVATMLGASYSAMQFLCMPAWGRLSDRIGRRPVMLSSIFFSAVTMLALGTALAWSDTILWVFAARMASGFATANLGTASAYIADITTPAERVKGMGLFGIAFGLGFLIGPAIGGLLAGYTVNGRAGSYPCFIAAALSVVNLLWAFVRLPESLPPERRKPSTRSLSPLNMRALRDTFSTPGISRAVLTNHMIILAFSGLEMTYAMYATDAFHFSQEYVGWMFMLMGTTGALVQGGFMRRASGRYKETSLAITGLCLLAVGFLGFAVAPRFGVWMLIVVSCLIATGNGLTQPSLSAYVSRLADPARQGETLSANQSMSSLGRVFGPALAGFLYTVSPETPFIACAVINLSALICAMGMRSIQPVPTALPSHMVEA